MEANFCTLKTAVKPQINGLQDLCCVLGPLGVNTVSVFKCASINIWSFFAIFAKKFCCNPIQLSWYTRWGVLQVLKIVVLQKMDVGYYALLSQVTGVHIAAGQCLAEGQQRRVTEIAETVRSVSDPVNRGNFRSLHSTAFTTPEPFEFQPHHGDKVHISFRDGTCAHAVTRVWQHRQQALTQHGWCKNTEKKLKVLINLLHI